MPVGTQAAVKGLTVSQVGATGAEMLLGNTYHLALRPGYEVVQQLGGLHQFMGWDGPILTDSGGFQLFSLAQRTKVNDAGAIFQSHIDGRRFELTPEKAISIQEALGSDIAMVLDHVVALPNSERVIREACYRTMEWASRSLRAASREDQVLFGIVQGGLSPELRKECAVQLAQLGFKGYAIGGLSVGESPEDMYRILEVTCPALPCHSPRYLMGVGRPQDLLESVSRGIDLFDCVMPTRNGRNALAFTDEGPVRLRNKCFQRDPRPLETACPCPACQHSRGYLRHLFLAGEMLGPILLSAHNLTYYQRVLAEARKAIMADQFTEFKREKLRRWTVGASAGDHGAAGKTP